MEEKMNQLPMEKQLLSLLVPEEILTHFDVQEIKERSSSVTIELIEKKERTPVLSLEKELVLNGYLNNVELQTYPIQGKKCFLNLKRRRWKEKGTDGKQSYWNEYDFAAEGTKATKAFGAFLKEYLS